MDAKDLSIIVADLGRAVQATTDPIIAQMNRDLTREELERLRLELFNALRNPGSMVVLPEGAEWVTLPGAPADPTPTSLEQLRARYSVCESGGSSGE